jgi:hypothetical protein
MFRKQYYEKCPILQVSVELLSSILVGGFVPLLDEFTKR